MASSGYQAWSVTAGEIPTTAYWNILGYNDASFNTGNGFNDSILIARHFAANSVLSGSLGFSSGFTGGVTSYTPTITSTTGGSWGSAVGYYINLGGIKMTWGTVVYTATTTSGHASVSAPPSFFSTIQIGIPAIQSEGNFAFQTASGDTFQTSTFPFYVNNTGNTGSATVSWFVIGT